MQIVRKKFDSDIKKLIKLLDDTYDKYQSVDISWYDRYSCNSFIYLLYIYDEVVGYAYASPITKKLFYDFLDGNIINDYEINPDQYLENSNYYYLASVLVKQEYRKKGYGSTLLENLLKDIETKEIIAMSISNEGYKICRKFLLPVKRLDNEKNILRNQVLRC